MNLRWKFWRRTQDRSPAVLPPTDSWLPLASARELLGLQRVIGNPAVLDLLALRERQSLAQGKLAKNRLRLSFWRKTRRN